MATFGLQDARMRHRNKERGRARSCPLRAARRALRGAGSTEDRRADRCHHQDLGHLRLRVRPVALPRHPAGQRADPDGPRVLRRRRGGRQRGPVGQARPVHHRLVLRLRQHLSRLPARLPVVLPARRRVHRRRAGALPACPARGRDAGGHAACAPGRPAPEPALDLRRPGRRLVRCRRGQRAAGEHGCGHGRRCGRPHRRALRQADGC